LLLVVELFGLLASPISWTHHWVWLVPLMIWLIHGPLSERVGTRVLGWGWLALTLVGVPWLLSFAQPSIWQGGRPWYLAWAGLVYVVAALVTLGWIAASGRERHASVALGAERHAGVTLDAGQR
jgi:alpha-1,2-mannosyltransferase